MNEPCPADLTGSQSHPRQMECLYAELGEARQAMRAFLARMDGFPLFAATVMQVAAKELEEMRKEAERS